MVSDPVAVPEYPADISVAVTLNPNVPDALVGGASVNVDEALAPGDSDEMGLGENAADHPLGTPAARLNPDAGQLELFLFVTVTVYVFGALEDSEMAGGAFVHGAPPPPRLTRIIAPAGSVDSVSILRAPSLKICPTSNLES